MKNIIPITLFFILFFINDTVAGLGLYPKQLAWALEGFIAVIAVVVVARIIATKSFNLPIKYVLLFIGFLYVVLAGVIINEVPTFTFIAGIRTYFKYIPIFLLPLAYDYSVEDLKKQFLVLVSFGLIQIPVALYQRIVLFKAANTGDIVSGTLNNSNAVSIVLMSIIIILFALYFRKIITLRNFAILAIVLFIPSTLNETRVTPILLVAGIAAVIFVYRKQMTMKTLISMVSSGLVMLVMFVTLYNALYGKESGPGFIDTFSRDITLQSYMYKAYQADPKTVLEQEKDIVGFTRGLPETDEKLIGRIDSSLIPIKVLFAAPDISNLFFGLGLGNVSSWRTDAQYKYINVLGAGMTSFALFLWETGIIGITLFLTILIFIARDSYALAQSQSVHSVFAAGWFGIALIMVITIIYNNFLYANELAALFMYFSGMVITIKHRNMKTLANNPNN